MPPSTTLAIAANAFFTPICGVSDHSIIMRESHGCSLRTIMSEA